MHVRNGTTDDEGFELEGKIEQALGHLQQAGEKVKETLNSGPNRKEHCPLAGRVQSMDLSLLLRPIRGSQLPLEDFS